MGGNEMDKTKKEKVESYSVATLTSIAEQRGGKIAWAEDAIRKSLSVTERDALKLTNVDLVAADIPTLLHQVDGRTSPARRQKSYA